MIEKVLNETSVTPKITLTQTEYNRLVEQGMTVLDLVLTYKWYDMIESGEKPEEYRDNTPYWRKRLQSGKRYTHVCFHRGYTAKTMVFRYDGLRMGRGNTQWGAPADRDVFIISLGERYK